MRGSRTHYPIIAVLLKILHCAKAKGDDNPPSRRPPFAESLSRHSAKIMKMLSDVFKLPISSMTPTSAFAEVGE